MLFINVRFVTFKELRERFANELGLSIEQVSTYMEELRRHAVEKLTAKKLYQEKGLATLKCKLSGDIPNVCCLLDKI